MRLQLLPSYFKKIGAGLFFLTFWPNFLDGYIKGYNDAQESSVQPIESLQEFTFLGMRLTPESFLQTASVLSMIGLIMIIMSRDKVFDEFLRELRLEAMQVTFLLSTIYLFSIMVLEVNLQAQVFLELQVLAFFITYNIKKMNARPEA